MPITRRHRWLATLTLLVLGAHLWLTDSVRHGLLDMAQEAPRIERMDIDQLDDMTLSEPPVMAPPQAAPEPEVALAPEPAPSRPKPPPRKEVPKPPPEAAAAELPVAAAAAAEEASTAEPDVPPVAASPAPSEPGAPPFEWPLATRITFKLEGNFRGPLVGTAQVEWVRQDDRYQVRIDSSAGLLAAQQSTSEGVITPNGLEPRRFESVNRLFVKTNKPRLTLFEGDEVVLSTGVREPKLDGVQDPASHFIQLAYDLLLGRQRLEVGGTVALPMALAKKQQALMYDVVSQEVLNTPMGPLDTFKLVPRRPPDQKEDVLAEIWLAPSLQYLPVRMLVRQGTENFLDMQMDKPPQQRNESDASTAAASAKAPVNGRRSLRAGDDTAVVERPSATPRQLDPTAIQR